MNSEKEIVMQAKAAQQDTQIAVIDEPQAPAETSAPISILAVIERAARDPSVDIDKMRQLLDIHRQMQSSTARMDYDRAMSAAQKDMRPINADASNPQTKSKYASYYALDNAIRPIYTKHGFALSFDTADGAAADHVRVVCNVAHIGGHRERTQLDMPSDGKGAKGGDVMTKTHATGSAITYAKRYMLLMIFNLAVGGDDDGNAAGDRGAVISTQQKDELVALMKETDADTAAFLKWIGAASVDEIKATDFNKARLGLTKKRAQK